MDQYDHKEFSSRNQNHEFNSTNHPLSPSFNQSRSNNSFDHDGNIHLSPFNNNNSNNNNNNNISSSNNHNNNQSKIVNDIGLTSSTYEWNRYFVNYLLIHISFLFIIKIIESIFYNLILDMNHLMIF